MRSLPWILALSVLAGCASPPAPSFASEIALIAPMRFDVVGSLALVVVVEGLDGRIDASTLGVRPETAFVAFEEDAAGALTVLTVAGGARPVLSASFQGRDHQVGTPAKSPSGSSTISLWNYTEPLWGTPRLLVFAAASSAGDVPEAFVVWVNGSARVLAEARGTSQRVVPSHDEGGEASLAANVHASATWGKSFAWETREGTFATFFASVRAPTTTHAERSRLSGPDGEWGGDAFWIAGGIVRDPNPELDDGFSVRGSAGAWRFDMDQRVSDAKRVDTLIVADVRAPEGFPAVVLI